MLITIERCLSIITNELWISNVVLTGFKHNINDFINIRLLRKLSVAGENVPERGSIFARMN